MGEAYAVPFHPNTVARMIEDVAETYVIDSDPFKIEKLWRIVYYSEGKDAHSVQSCRSRDQL